MKTTLKPDDFIYPKKDRLENIMKFYYDVDEREKVIVTTASPHNKMFKVEKWDFFNESYMQGTDHKERYIRQHRKEAMQYFYKSRMYATIRYDFYAKRGEDPYLVCRNAKTFGKEANKLRRSMIERIRNSNDAMSKLTTYKQKYHNDLPGFYIDFFDTNCDHIGLYSKSDLDFNIAKGKSDYIYEAHIYLTIPIGKLYGFEKDDYFISGLHFLELYACQAGVRSIAFLENIIDYREEQVVASRHLKDGTPDLSIGWKFV